MIHLLYCGNSRVFGGVLMSALSAAHHSSEPLNVHIATMDWSEKNSNYTPITGQQAKFVECKLRARNPGSCVTLHDMKDGFIKELSQSPNACTSYTPYTLLRLLVDITDGMPQKILYLDTDTLVLSDIKQVYDTDVRDTDFAAAHDYLGRIFISPGYMNAGVMLMNIGHMQESGLLRDARCLCRKKRFAFPDQDVLNKCEKHKMYLPRCFNEQKRRDDSTVIRHFSKTIRWLPYFHTVNVKPWDEHGLHNIYKTHFYDENLEEYALVMKEWEGENSRDEKTGC